MAFISLQEHKNVMPMKFITILHYLVDLVPICLAYVSAAAYNGPCHTVAICLFPTHMWKRACI